MIPRRDDSAIGGLGVLSSRRPTRFQSVLNAIGVVQIGQLRDSARRSEPRVSIDHHRQLSGTAVEPRTPTKQQRVR